MHSTLSLATHVSSQLFSWIGLTIFACTYSSTTKWSIDTRALPMVKILWESHVWEECDLEAIAAAAFSLSAKWMPDLISFTRSVHTVHVCMYCRLLEEICVVELGFTCTLCCTYCTVCAILGMLQKSTVVHNCVFYCVWVLNCIVCMLEYIVKHYTLQYITWNYRRDLMNFLLRDLQYLKLRHLRFGGIRQFPSLVPCLRNCFSIL